MNDAPERRRRRGWALSSSFINTISFLPPPPATARPPVMHTVRSRSGAVATGVLAAVRAGENPAGRLHVRRRRSGAPGKGSGVRPGYGRHRPPAMAPSQGVVRPSPVAPQRSGRCPKLPHAVRPESRTTPSENVHRGQVDTEFNPSPSPSGPLASVRFHRPNLKLKKGREREKRG